MALPLRPLGNTGLLVSPIGFGGGPFGGFYGSFDESEGIRAVHHAIDQGINLIDTSPYYGGGKSEEILGKALVGGWRGKVFLATKAGRIAKDVFDFTFEGMVRSCETSLKLLQTDHVDILQAHDIEFEPNLDWVFDETWRALDHLRQQGKCRFIGMTGYPLGALEKAINNCKLDVVISYCHASLNDTTMITKLLPVAEARGTGIINASSLSMGLLTQAAPPAWHPAPQEVKTAVLKAAAHCARKGADLATLAQQFTAHLPGVTTTLVGMSNIREVDTNIAAVSTKPDPEMLQAVLEILKPISGMGWPSGAWPA
jgi:L-galactose dehydrogenase